MTLKNTPALNKYNFELKDNCIYLSKNTKEIICSSIDSEEQRQELANKIIELEKDLPQPSYLLKNEAYPFEDTTSG